MKTKLLTSLCALAVAAGTIDAKAADGPASDSTANAVVDVAIARPLCFAATVVGSACFLVSLPVAAMTKKGVSKSAEALVYRPGRATFKRDIGDFSGLQD